MHASAGAAVAALIASHERHRSGQGQHIDISAQQAVAQATQSSILAGPLSDAEISRMSGGTKIGALPIRLVWPAKDGHVAITYLFGSAFAHFTKRLMDWIYEEGMCDEATQQTDWVAYGGYLFSGPEAIEDYKRLTQIVEGLHHSPRPRPSCYRARSTGVCWSPRSPPWTRWSIANSWPRATIGLRSTTVNSAGRSAIPVRLPSSAPPRLPIGAVHPGSGSITMRYMGRSWV